MSIANEQERRTENPANMTQNEVAVHKSKDHLASLLVCDFQQTYTICYTYNRTPHPITIHLS